MTTPRPLGLILTHTLSLSKASSELFAPPHHDPSPSSPPPSNYCSRWGHWMNLSPSQMICTKLTATSTRKYARQQHAMSSIPGLPRTKINRPPSAAHSVALKLAHTMSDLLEHNAVRATRAPLIHAKLTPTTLTSLVPHVDRPRWRKSCWRTNGHSARTRSSLSGTPPSTTSNCPSATLRRVSARCVRGPLSVLRLLLSGFSLPQYHVCNTACASARSPQQHVSGIEHDMKSRVSSYSKTKQNLQAIDRKTKWVPRDSLYRLLSAV